MFQRQVQDSEGNMKQRKPDAGDVSGVRRHRGDIMSPATRSAVMSRIRGKNTKPEETLRKLLLESGLDPERHAKDLPGRPDFVFRKERVVIFVDGDFWHGYRFEEWRLNLSEAWERKIAANMSRDRKNRRLLRRDGWTVLAIWEHRLKAHPKGCLKRILRALTVI